MTIKGTATSFDAMYGDHESGRASTIIFSLVHCMSEPLSTFSFSNDKEPLAQRRLLREGFLLSLPAKTVTGTPNRFNIVRFG